MQLREIRKERNLSMKKLGDAVGVSESAISLYERGLKNPSYETLLKIAEYFNCSLDHLLGRDIFAGASGPVDDAAPSFLTDCESRLLETFRLLPPGKQAQVLEYAVLLSGNTGRAPSLRTLAGTGKSAV